MQADLLENKTNSYWYILRYAGLHLLLLISVYIIYVLITGRELIHSPNSFYRNDVRFYAGIKNSGYNYVDYTGTNIAFFPGFPYLWRFTGLGIYGIIVLNILMFYSGFVLIAKQFVFSKKEILLFLSLPSLCFMYVPYSEALFFLVSVFLLCGMLKQNTIMVMIGLFVCSLCRSAANVFLPAIIITELIAASNPHRFRNILLYSFSALAGVFIVSWLQYSQTGEWIGFIKTQKYWGVGFRFPQLPFTTWGDKNYLDGGALLAGICASAMMVYYFFRWIFKVEQQKNKAFIFSLLCVAGLTFFTIAFKGGSLFSLNRYIIPTAFFAVAFSFSMRQLQLSFKQVWITLFCIFAFWLVMGSYVHILVLAGYLLFTLYILLYLFLNNKNALIGNIAFYLVYVINLIVQVMYFYQFTTGGWVG